ncbi:MAG: AtpZ/AtpI family protein [Lachnospiraceae bacterium]|nr:AtpZ/AtpI family protein [Lachnospiraceae bacterium]
MQKNSIGKSITLILQIGLTMMVSIFLCLWAGIWLNNKFNTVWFVPLFLVLGIGGGFNSAWKLVKSYAKKDESTEAKTNEYIENLKAEGRKNKELRK